MKPFKYDEIMHKMFLGGLLWILDNGFPVEYEDYKMLELEIIDASTIDPSDFMVDKTVERLRKHFERKKR